MPILPDRKITRFFVLPVFIFLSLMNLKGISSPDSHRISEDVSPTPAETTLLPTETETLVQSETPGIDITETLSTTAIPSSTSTFILTDTPTATFTRIPPIYLSGNYLPDQIVVKVESGHSAESLASCLGQINGQLESSISDLDILVIKIPNDTVGVSVYIMNNCLGVEYAEPNYIAQMADTIPNDTGWNNQYGLISIRAPQGWDLSIGSASVTIAIVDTGVDLMHPDLTGKIVPGFDFVNNDSIAQDDNGHGSHVAGIAAANSNNSTGVAGVSWGARIMPVKVLNASGNGTYVNVAQGIDWATDHGAQIVNLSLGGSNPASVLEDAVNYAYQKGVTLVASSGNTGATAVFYPAHYPHVIAVGAVDNLNNHAPYSNSGPELNLVAPGTSIYSTLIGAYGLKTGTSMSAPFVSGLAAILRGLPGGVSPDIIAWQMESSALDLGAPGRDTLYGFGLIQMDRAILLAIPTATPTQTPSLTSTNTAIFFPIYTSTRINFPFYSTSSLSPSPIISATLAVNTPSQTSGPSAQPGITPVTSSIEPDLNAQSIQGGATGQVLVRQNETSYLLPCLGILCILMGLVLLLLARKLRK
jgi:subtilisin family serine protease